MLLLWLVTLALLLTPAAPSHGNLPSIFILGAQKGGSSSLFEFLLEHPTLCKGDHKEPHFFDDWKVYGWKVGACHVYSTFIACCLQTAVSNH